MMHPDDLTQDDFLGGQLVLTQPRTGYRAGVDPVFLASAVSAQSGQSVLELGCGVGAASLCLGRRVPGLELHGIERQADHAEMARKNAEDNGISLTVHDGDLAQMPEALRAQSFDHVIMNPPYFDRTRGSMSPHDAREQAMGEETPLAAWMDQATRRLKPRGMLTMINAAERLPDILSSLDDRLGSVVVQPLSPRSGRAAKLLLLQARKGGRAAFRLAAPIVLHEGAAHTSDREHYTPAIQATLRDGAALNWG
ncbi:methyltransferase [Aliiroseovarius sp. S1123]|jgi:tRNA1(Val) A37 N6-methylase TrmN6|uniref:tRNA1(Val) (adenine(37)-N6)-methyltransferase n=1 Tax=unclassified Aliiroseovarius TaxID=2623558 RepID=UPI001FF51A36|nr:methyltransferase [Aliiroseovarius sp. S1123]MCK0171235.1 methyltransferase [Aliiroseovarius sp. S1123]